jgi:predicted RNA polymerase sigma factor
MPDDGEVAGLLALMLLAEARRTARVSAGGELVTLVEQDRGTWDAALIAEGHRLVRERLAAGEAPGRYQLLAAISADLLRRLGRSQQSRAACNKAIELAGNTAETAYLTRRRDQLG